MNVLIVLAAGFMLLGRLNEYQLFNKYIRPIFSVLVVINPITLPQSQSYYNDGMMQMLIYITILSLVNLTVHKRKEKCRQVELSIFVQCLNPQNYAASANGCSRCLL